MVLAAAASMLVVLLPSAVRPGETIRQLEIPGHGALEIAMPAEWRFAIDPAAEPPAMLIEPPSGSRFALIVTPHPLSSGARPSDAEYYARQAIDRARRHVAPTALEDPIAIEELRGSRNAVFWFAATKKAPARGEHAHVVVGAAAVGRLTLVFTLRHHRGELPERAVVLRAIEEARHVGPASTEPFALALPLESWALLVDLHGFQIDGFRTWADGSGVTMTGANPTNGLAVTMFLQRVEGRPNVKDCFRVAFDRALATPFHKIDVKRGQRDGMAIGEYLVPRFRDVEINRKHVHAYLAREGVCAHVYLSKQRFAPGDQEHFEAVLRTVRFGEPAP
jgi:hypothetical protein